MSCKKLLRNCCHHLTGICCLEVDRIMSAAFRPKLYGTYTFAGVPDGMGGTYPAFGFPPLLEFDPVWYLPSWWQTPLYSYSFLGKTWNTALSFGFIHPTPGDGCFPLSSLPGADFSPYTGDIPHTLSCLASLGDGSIGGCGFILSLPVDICIPKWQFFSYALMLTEAFTYDVPIGVTYMTFDALEVTVTL